MSDPPGLEMYYSGDSAWRALAKAVESEWSNCPFGDQLVAELSGDRRLAVVVWYHLGSQALKWLDTTPPVLNGLSPRECLATTWGQKRLKEALMRFP